MTDFYEIRVRRYTFERDGVRGVGWCVDAFSGRTMVHPPVRSDSEEAMLADVRRVSGRLEARCDDGH